MKLVKEFMYFQYAFNFTYFWLRRIKLLDIFFGINIQFS